MDATMSPPKPSATEPPCLPSRSEPAKRKRGALPAHLPWVDLVVDVEEWHVPVSLPRI